MLQFRQPAIIKLWNLLSFGKPGHPAFLPEELLRRATKRSGLSDFGNMDFIEGLGTFVDSASETDGFHPFGRFYLKQLVTAMLVHRLKLVELFRTHPEIDQEHIDKPLFVLGLPRSGTTLLFNLLAQDPCHRYMFNWEAFIGQVPPQGSYTFETDPRRKQAMWMLRFQKYLMPDLDMLHEFSAGGSEECTPVLMQGFATQALAGGYNVPPYSTWLDGADHDPTYRHHKRVLQALQWKYPGERWLLKSPDHLAAVDSIVKSYPDARFVHIHRDPAQSVASWASLNLLYRGLYYPEIDKNELGGQILDRLASDMDRYMAVRATHQPMQIFDVQYTDLITDPLAVIRRAYDHFGLTLSLEVERNISGYLEANPEHKHGVHRYRPEDFGLTLPQIQDRFSLYIHEYLESPNVV